MDLEEALAELEKQKEANKKTADEAAHYRKTGKELKDQLAKFDGFDVEEHQKLKTKADDLEKERLKQEGKFEEALAKSLKSKDDEIASLKDKLVVKDTALSKQLIDNSVIMSIDGKAVNNEQVLSLIRPDIKMDGESPIVMNGEIPLTDDKGVQVSVGDYAKSFLEKNPHLANPGGGGSGSNGNKSNQNANAKTVSRATFNDMTPQGQSAHCKDGGTITD